MFAQHLDHGVELPPATSIDDLDDKVDRRHRLDRFLARKGHVPREPLDARILYIRSVCRGSGAIIHEPATMMDN